MFGKEIQWYETSCNMSYTFFSLALCLHFCNYMLPINKKTSKAHKGCNFIGETLHQRNKLNHITQIDGAKGWSALQWQFCNLESLHVQTNTCVHFLNNLFDWKLNQWPLNCHFLFVLYNCFETVGFEWSSKWANGQLMFDAFKGAFKKCGHPGSVWH